MAYYQAAWDMIMNKIENKPLFIVLCLTAFLLLGMGVYSLWSGNVS